MAVSSTGAEMNFLVNRSHARAVMFGALYGGEQFCRVFMDRIVGRIDAFSVAQRGRSAISKTTTQ